MKNFLLALFIGFASVAFGQQVPNMINYQGVARNSVGNVLPNKKIPTGWLVAANPDANSVTIQWYMDFHLRWYPWEKFSSFMFERIYHPQLQQGLDNLKRFLEK